MKKSRVFSRATRRRMASGTCMVWAVCAAVARGDNLTVIGVTQLRAVDPSLVGTGVTVAQPESSSVTGGVNQNNFEVNPFLVGIPVSRMTYVNSTGATATGSFPNLVGTDNTASGHADTVAGNFYGSTGGVAPDVTAVWNYDALYFFNTIILNDTPIAAKVVNQSFVLTPTNPANGPLIEQDYDNYVADNNVIILSGAGDGIQNNQPNVQLPASAYNVIAVGLYDPVSTIDVSVGPVEGRAKPDIAAPGGAASYATPLVSGVAAVLVQAGNSGLGGPGTAVAASTDARTVKALLLNGAVKPTGWTHSQMVPLDLINGSGIVNAFNSYENLLGLEQVPSVAGATVGRNSPHPSLPGTAVNWTGWNLQSIATSIVGNTDTLDHYLIDVTTGGSLFELTATMTWYRPSATSVVGINNIDLFLLNTATNAQVAASISMVDNVEHLASVVLPPGRYDLEVLKHGGQPGNNSNVVSTGDTYALAWNMTAINTAGPITSNNGYLEFVTSQTVNGIADNNTVQVDSGVTLQVASNASINVGAFTNNGTLAFNPTLGTPNIASSITGAGTLVHMGTGTTTLSGTYSATGPISVTAGKLIFGATAAARQTAGAALVMQSLTLSSGTALDVTNHDLMVGNASMATVENEILNGIGLGSGGAAILSSTAAADGDKYLVPVVASVFGGVGGTFDGVTITQPNTVLVKYTYKGDVNLDGKVSTADYLVLNGNFGKTDPGLADIAAALAMGDVNLDGKISTADYLVLNGNFGKGTTAGNPLLGTVGGLGSGGGGVGANGVPEPGSLGVLGVVGVALLRRRGRLKAKG